VASIYSYHKWATSPTTFFHIHGLGKGGGDQEEWEKVQEKEDHHLLTQHFDLEDEKSPQKRNYS